MMTDIEREMRATYSASKTWWARLIYLWLAAGAVAGASQLPVTRTVSALLAIVGFAISIGTFVVRWRAEALHQTAESLRRVHLLADGLGATGSAADIARVRASASNAAHSEPTPIGGYYTSTLDQGWRRAIHNIQESAFYTEHLAQHSGWLGVGILSVVLVAALAGLFWLASIGSDGHGAASTANALFGCVSAIVAGTVADMTRAYFTLSKDAGKCFDRASILLRTERIEERDAVAVINDYDSSLANVPPIPAWLYRREQARLDRLWEAARTLPPT